MIVGDGIAYPCITMSKCPTTTNAASFVFNGMGAGEITHSPNKSKAGVEAGTWSINTSGVYRGSCGMATTNFLGNLFPTVTVGGKAKGRTFVGQTQEVGGANVGPGTTSKGETLTIVYTMTLISGSCLNKGPKSFLVAGSMQVTRVP